MIEYKEGEMKLAVVLSGDLHLDFAIANVIIGLKRYNEDLIDTIFVYSDMPQWKRVQITSLWADRIVFVNFAYKDFARDFMLSTGGEIPKLIAENKRFGHYIYAKFYCFEYLNEYENVLWLDTDTLCLGSLAPILCGEFDFKYRKGGSQDLINYLLHCEGSKNTKSVMKAQKPNGGVLSFSRNILDKTQLSGVELRKECYKITLDLLSKGFLKRIDGSDENPFGVIAYRFKLAFAPLVVANIPLYEADSQSVILHSTGDSKFWNSPLAPLLFNEWWLNHKQWEKIAGKKELELRQSNLSLQKSGDLYNSLRAMHYFKPFVDMFGDYFVGDMYLGFCFNQELCVYSKTFGKSAFYRFYLGRIYEENNIPCELQLVLLKSYPEEFLESLKSQFGNVKCETKQGEVIYHIKQVNIKNPKNVLGDLLFLHSVSFRLIKGFDAKFEIPVCTSAKSRIQNHLAYKMGQILTHDSKHLSGILKMPFKLSGVYLAHNKVQKEYKVKIKNNPSLKLLSLESYPDYQESLKIKNHFSYKLGEAFLTTICAGGGGIICLYPKSA